MSTMMPPAPDRNPPDAQDCASPVTALGQERLQAITDAVAALPTRQCAMGVVVSSIEWTLSYLREQEV